MYLIYPGNTEDRRQLMIAFENIEIATCSNKKICTNASDTGLSGRLFKKVSFPDWVPWSTDRLGGGVPRKILVTAPGATN
jgi:hypothetical protein